MSYLLDIKSLYKLKRIINLYSKKEVNLIPIFYFSLKKKGSLIIKIKKELGYSSTKDYLIIGNHYNFYLTNALFKRNLSTQSILYYSLLKDQYLSNN
jgi:hypothetical protein